MEDAKPEIGECSIKIGLSQQLDCYCGWNIKKKKKFFFLVFLDGQKSKEELLAAVCKYVFQEIERLMGKLQLFSRNNFWANYFNVSDII